jgi:hypothetical protein
MKCRRGQTYLASSLEILAGRKLRMLGEILGEGLGLAAAILKIAALDERIEIRRLLRRRRWKLRRAGRLRLRGFSRRASMFEGEAEDILEQIRMICVLHALPAPDGVVSPGQT